jgi:hypothetical protein
MEPGEILLVEDDPHDVELTLMALAENHLSNEIASGISCTVQNPPATLTAHLVVISRSASNTARSGSSSDSALSRFQQRSSRYMTDTEALIRPQPSKAGYAECSSEKTAVPSESP